METKLCSQGVPRAWGWSFCLALLSVASVASTGDFEGGQIAEAVLVTMDLLVCGLDFFACIAGHVGSILGFVGSSPAERVHVPVVRELVAGAFLGRAVVMSSSSWHVQRGYCIG
jgi:hypothetical protein